MPGRGRFETGPYARRDARCAEDGMAGDWIPAEDAGMTEKEEDGRVRDAAPTQEGQGRRKDRGGRGAGRW